MNTAQNQLNIAPRGIMQFARQRRDSMELESFILSKYFLSNLIHATNRINKQDTRRDFRSS